MALSFLFICFSILQIPFFSTATLHLSPKNETSTTFFEVTNPIKLPKTKPCSYLVLKHDFAHTYGKSPILTDYTPPSNCPSKKFSKIILEWKATSEGRQFDRIFGIWLGGVEIFRSCTAEPIKKGIIWTVKKDITKYHSLLMTNQTLAVYIGNMVDSTYTGVYHVEIFVHFYPTEKESNLGKEFNSGADLILPISRNLPLNDGLWFKIVNSTDVQSKEFKIPQNVYRAVLEIYVSFHENDEYWYGNLPNGYVTANNRSDIQGNGAFREVLVSLDGVVAGAVWPFTVIYTGGFNPLLWRPISGIGSFDLPSYDIDITPLLGKILDGSSHNISFSVTNALNAWYVDANVHLWLDKKSVKTKGKLLEYSSSPLTFSLASNFTGLDGSFVTNARRSISLTGWVNSSYGTVTTRSSQSFSYNNYMMMGNNANLKIVDQTIEFNDTVNAKTRSSSVQVLESFKKFQLHVFTDGVKIGDQNSATITNVTLIFDEKRLKNGSSASSVHNMQNAQGFALLKNASMDSGLGSTRQTYKYDDDQSCYFRNISSSNYTVIYDNVSNSCS